MQHDASRSKKSIPTISPDELARELGVSRHGIYVGLRNGSIPSIRLGRRFVIPRTAIEHWLETAGKSLA
jgi:excisionase family DNA binding protein